MVDASSPTAEPARIPQTYTVIARVNAPDWYNAPATTSPSARKATAEGTTKNAI